MNDEVFETSDSAKRKKSVQPTMELELFCYTSGVSFLSLENFHFKKFISILNAAYFTSDLL